MHIVKAFSFLTMHFEFLCLQLKLRESKTILLVCMQIVIPGAKNLLFIPFPLCFVFSTCLKVYNGESTKRLEIPLQLNFITLYVLGMDFLGRFTFSLLVFLKSFFRQQLPLGVAGERFPYNIGFEHMLINLYP